MGTIPDDDAAPRIRIGDVRLVEGQTGARYAVFTLSLSAASGQTVTVDYATANRTAAAGRDYLAGAGTVGFRPGVTTRRISVPVLGDTRDEPNETFVVNLRKQTNVTLADAQGLGTITDDD